MNENEQRIWEAFYRLLSLILNTNTDVKIIHPACKQFVESVCQHNSILIDEYIENIVKDRKLPLLSTFIRKLRELYTSKKNELTLEETKEVADRYFSKPRNN